MKSMKPGELVRVVDNLEEVPDISRSLLPMYAWELLGKTVTILDQPLQDWPLYRICEDNGHRLYPAAFFKPMEMYVKETRYHCWTREELDEAARLICRLLMAPDKVVVPGACYRFIDLVTPYQTDVLKKGRPRILLIRSSVKGAEHEVFIGTASDHDEPNAIIGMAVCLCKLKGEPIPEWILHPTEKKEPSKCN